MTIVHHPSSVVLAEFANSILDETAALVVGVHISHCTSCQQTVRQFEALGGALLDDCEPDSSLQMDAHAVLARAERAASTPGSLHEPHSVRGQSGDVLSHYECGEWRWLGPGIHWRKVSVPTNQDVRVFLLKAKAGTLLPHHKHSGIEWTQVMEGAFAHAHGRFGPGDFDEADSSIEHVPVVEKGADCICLVALNGRLELQGVLGRMMQPFVRL
jgi:putative transcriptional regulator